MQRSSHLAGRGEARVLIDGTMARSGGGLTYLVNVVSRIAQLAREDPFLLLVRSERIACAIPASENLTIDLLPPVGLAGRLGFALSGGARIAARWGADLYFSAGEGVPLHTGCPRIASFRNPNLFVPIDPEYAIGERIRLLALRALAKLSARLCDRILFVSEDSARWIGDSIGLPIARRAVVHHGIDVDRWRAAPRIPLHPSPYILSVSSIYRYKNFVRLIEAYALLAKRHPELDLPDLVIVGDDQDPPYARAMEAARAATGELAARIHVLGEVPYADVAAWYAGARLFVFPSFLETFGHPLLEAMAAETPLVAADLPVFREIAGGAALYADPFRVGDLADVIAQALEPTGAREARTRSGLERARRFSWDRTAARHLALFSRVLSERGCARLRWSPAGAELEASATAPGSGGR